MPKEGMPSTAENFKARQEEESRLAKERQKQQLQNRTARKAAGTPPETPSGAETKPVADIKEELDEFLEKKEGKTPG